MICWKKNYNFGFNHGNCVDVYKEIMCWYEFLKCYAKIYGFSLLDAWSCFRLYFHVVFDHKHLKLEPLIFENKKNDIFMGCGMKPAKRDEFLGTFAHARTLFRAREIGRSSPLFSRVLRARDLSLRARETFLAHARHDFACAKVNIVQHICVDFSLLFDLGL